MGKDVNQYVLSLLETYPETSKRIELMRYELYSSMVVSPQEMIEVMSFSKKDAEANAKSQNTRIPCRKLRCVTKRSPSASIMRSQRVSWKHMSP